MLQEIIPVMDLAKDVTVNTPDTDVAQKLLTTVLPGAAVIVIITFVLYKIWNAMPKGPLLFIVIFVLAALGYVNFK